MSGRHPQPPKRAGASKGQARPAPPRASSGAAPTTKAKAAEPTAPKKAPAEKAARSHPPGAVSALGLSKDYGDRPALAPLDLHVPTASRWRSSATTARARPPSCAWPPACSTPATAACSSTATRPARSPPAPPLAYLVGHPDVLRGPVGLGAPRVRRPPARPRGLGAGRRRPARPPRAVRPGRRPAHQLQPRPAPEGLDRHGLHPPVRRAARRRALRRPRRRRQGGAPRAARRGARRRAHAPGRHPRALVPRDASAAASRSATASWSTTARPRGSTCCRSCPERPGRRVPLGRWAVDRMDADARPRRATVPLHARVQLGERIVVRSRGPGREAERGCGDGWEVVAIVPTGGDVSAFLRRGGEADREAARRPDR